MHDQGSWPKPPTCGVLDRLEGSTMKFEVCGQPRDDKLSRMLGEDVCADHGEDKMTELMSE